MRNVTRRFHGSSRHDCDRFGDGFVELQQIRPSARRSRRRPRSSSFRCRARVRRRAPKPLSYIARRASRRRASRRTPSSACLRAYSSAASISMRKGVRRGSRKSASMRPYVLLVASVAALGGLLFGYDTGVISGAILFISKDFSLSTRLQEFTISVVLIGCIGGAAVTGTIADAIGRRLTLLAAGIVFLVGALVSAFAPNETVLVRRTFHRRHRHRFQLGRRAALHLGSRAGERARRARLALSVCDYGRHSRRVSHRLCVRARRALALDARLRGRSFARAGRRDDRHAREPALSASRSVTTRARATNCCASPTTAKIALKRSASIRESLKVKNAGFAALRTPAVRLGALHRRHARGAAASHRHQHRHLLRPADLPDGRHRLAFGVDSRARRSSAR